MSLKESMAGLLGGGELPPFPKSFLFGVATADHQCEARKEGCEDIRDRWEAEHCPKAARGKATDFWNRYEEDIELASKLGCKAFRFSIAWSRVEPAPGQFRPQAFDHYRKLIDKIISCHMVPVLTLHHFTWPLFVEEQGGMTADGFPDTFARYVREVARRFAGDVPYWITFNEPNLLVGGYLKPWWDASYAAPPGLPEGTTSSEQVEAVGRLMRNLFLSHRQACEIIKAENREAKIGVNQYIYGLPRWVEWLVSRNASSVRGNPDLQRQLDHLASKRDLIRGERISGIRARTLDKDKVDVVLAALSRTAEREEQVMFSEPYFLARPSLLAKTGSRAVEADDLAEREVAVVRGTTAEKNLSELLQQSRPVVCDHYEAALQALDQEMAAALLADNAVLSGLMDQHPGKYSLLEPLAGDGEVYAAAVAPGDDQLLEAVNSVIRDFGASTQGAEWRAGFEEATGLRAEEPPGTFRALALNKAGITGAAGAGIRASGAGQGQGTASEPLHKASPGTVLRRIQDRGYLVAGIREDLPHFGYRNPETGERSGLEVMLGQELARRILGDPEKVRFHPVTVQGRIESLDLMSGFLDWIHRQSAVLSTMLMTNWWYMGMAGELDGYLCPPGCESRMDFVGFDYYWGIPDLHLERLSRLLAAAYRRFDQAPVHPEALYNTLESLHKKFPNHPIIVFENGSVKEADGWKREDYIREHVRQVQRAVRDGLNVEGYICWSITSNREWDLEFSDASDFGLYHVELDGDLKLIRNKTLAADEYERIIKNQGV